MASAFELLGLPLTFDLDVSDIDASLRSAGLRWHPDRFATASAAERDHAEEQMAEFNVAHATLCNPLQRAIALLDVFACPYDPNGVNADPGFLMDMLEVKEQLHDAKQSNDSTALNKLIFDLRQREQQELSQLAKLFSEWETANNRTQDLPQLQQLLNQLHYLDRTIETSF
ncbi:MAG: Fe-S protein assembly co-chaperone HscB [Planctomycetes bacterium]|nr:Fe-S protein assembly co-chaperone HscB [Planctomycetota bacterium]